MKKLSLIIGGVAILGVGIGAVVMTQTPRPAPTREAAKLQGSISLAEVAQHATNDDCYMAIEGKVYNVTEYSQSGWHPGKEAILAGCGKDATKLFNTRPMGSGTAHSDKAREMLAKYEIGTLAQ